MIYIEDLSISLCSTIRSLPLVWMYIDDIFASLCSTCIKTCPSDDLQCRVLADTIKYQILELPKDTPAYNDFIIRLMSPNMTDDQTQHRKSYFSIKDIEEAENVSYYCGLFDFLLVVLVVNYGTHDAKNRT